MPYGPSQSDLADAFVSTFFKVLMYRGEWLINGTITRDEKTRKWICKEGTEWRGYGELKMQELVRRFLRDFDDGFSFGRQGVTLSLVRSVRRLAEGDQRYETYFDEK